MDRLPDRENTNFPLAITNALKSVVDHAFLMRHQVMPVEFFARYPKARGLLFCHETGLGKSISAAAIAENFISQGRRIIVIVTKGLQNNFKDNLTKYLLNTTNMTREEISKAVDKNYAFVSANASNMLAQLKNASLPIDMQEILDTDPDAETAAVPNKKTRDVYLDTINLEGALVICDEAHHLFNGIVSNSQNARGLYDVIMRTKDVRLLFLTSNVITNTPFELVPCFNMIAGYEIMPTIYNDFMDTFVERPKKSKAKDAKSGVKSGVKPPSVIKNADHFKARIYGMISYFGSWFESGGLLNIHSSVVRAGLPTRLPIKEVLVPMSDEQFGAYAMAREKETRLKTFSTTKVVALAKPSSSSGDSTYRIRSRLLSNYWQRLAEEPTPPEVNPEHQNDEKSPSVDESREYKKPPKTVEKLDLATLRALDIHSPKFAAMLDVIKKHSGQSGLIYSAFVKTHGLDWFAAALNTQGYSKYIIGDFEKKSRYAYITGDMTAEERSAVLFAFNGPENHSGEIIQLLLGSPAMSEGVDTKRIRFVLIMESPWHFSALEQIIARAVRYHSHDDLPASDRTVQPYIFLADYPAGTKRNDEPTTDVAMYYKALRKKLLNDQFFRALIEASIDCSVHIKDKSTSAAARKHIKCMMCAPTNKPMFKQDIIEDIAEPCACVQTKEQDIAVSEITYRGKTFYYKKEPSGALHLFEYDEPTSSYVRLSPMSKWYGALFKKLT